MQGCCFFHSEIIFCLVGAQFCDCFEIFFSLAAAELLTMMTGSEFFPGGLGEFVAKKNEFLVFEEGPSVDVVLPRHEFIAGLFEAAT